MKNEPIYLMLFQKEGREGAEWDGKGMVRGGQNQWGGGGWGGEGGEGDEKGIRRGK